MKWSNFRTALSATRISRAVELMQATSNISKTSAEFIVRNVSVAKFVVLQVLAKNLDDFREPVAAPHRLPVTAVVDIGRLAPHVAGRCVRLPKNTE